MPKRNPLRENGGLPPREQVKGEDIINTRTQRMVRLTGPDGDVQEIVMDAHDSRPDQNGGYIDSEFINLQTDVAGKILPKDPHEITALSHTGLYIDSPEKLAICSSIFHGSASRSILIGFDGRLLPNGRAICSRCEFWLRTVYSVLGIFSIGVILGIWRGAGIF